MQFVRAAGPVIAVRMVTMAWRASDDRRSRRLADFVGESAGHPSAPGHKPFELELGEPQVLRQAVVDLARQPRALLEGRALGLGQAQRSSAAYAQPQRPQVPT